MLPRMRSARWWVPRAFALVLLASHTEQLSDGAPSRACADMTPRHSDIAPQTSLPPYVVTASSSQVRQGGRVNVTVGSPGGAGAPIGGFMLQARSVQAPDTVVGRFMRVPDPSLEKTVRCQAEGDTATHTSPDPKHDLTFEWQAPTDLLGSVFFRATVAQSYATFWLGVESPLVEVVAADAVITSTPRSATTRATVTRPTFSAAETTPKTQQDPIYQGCSDTKLCFGSRPNCVAAGDCPAVVAVLVAGDTFTFELQALGGPAYVAAGLSGDRSMGDDSAMECVQTNGKVSLHASWTYPKTEPYVSRKDIPQDILRLQQSSFVDGKLYCRFTREANSTVRGVNFDLAANSYNLMVVAGSSMKDSDRVGFHDLAFESTGTALKLAAVGSAEGASKLLLRLHGAFMVVAWLGTASVGILLARYFRTTWVGKQLGGKDIWFAWHRILMVLTWLLTVCGFVLIVVEVGGYTTTGDNPHAITGLVTVILCFLQPIGAFFRPHPGTSKRPLFNWLHWLAGNSAHILGIATIFLAVYLNKSELPGWTVYILAAFVVFHVIMHVVLSLTVCVSDGRISNGRVNSFPMKDMMGNTRQALPVDRKTDAPYGGFRRLLLGVFVPVVALFTTAVVCLVALAPISQTVETVSSALNKVMGADPM